MKSHKIIFMLIALFTLGIKFSYAQTSTKTTSLNIAGYSSGKIPKASLIKASELSISNEDLGTIESFMLVVVAKMAYEDPVQGKDFPGFSYNAFKQTQSGSLILVDRVKLKHKDGTIVSHPELTLKLHVE